MKKKKNNNGTETTDLEQNPKYLHALKVKKKKKKGKKKRKKKSKKEGEKKWGKTSSTSSIYVRLI